MQNDLSAIRQYYETGNVNFMVWTSREVQGRIQSSYYPSKEFVDKASSIVSLDELSQLFNVSKESIAVWYGKLDAYSCCPNPLTDIMELCNQVESEKLKKVFDVLINCNLEYFYEAADFVIKYSKALMSMGLQDDEVQEVLRYVNASYEDICKHMLNSYAEQSLVTKVTKLFSTELDMPLRRKLAKLAMYKCDIKDINNVEQELYSGIADAINNGSLIYSDAVELLYGLDKIAMQKYIELHLDGNCKIVAMYTPGKNHKIIITEATL